MTEDMTESDLTESDLSRALDGIRSELSGLREDGRSLNGTIDRLHAENERLRHAEAKQNVQPTARELIKLADDWRSRSVALQGQPELARLCDEIVDDVTMVLDRQGVAEFNACSETEFDRHEQRAVGTRVTDNAKLNGYIAQARRPGYRAGEKVIRFAEVVVYKVAETESVAEPIAD
jgi:molecular chaperone GrpE (heat shock protein)